MKKEKNKKREREKNREKENGIYQIMLSLR